jgi:hypothetical protein
MKAIDIVKPEAKTELELWNRTMNHIQARNMSRLWHRTVIEVKQIEKINCTGRGRAACEQQGEHSWFNHSQDVPGGGELPEDLKGDPRYDI